MNEDENQHLAQSLEDKQHLKGIVFPAVRPSPPLLTLALCQALNHLPECCQFI